MKAYRIMIAAAAFPLALAAQPAGAQTVIDVPQFQSLQLRAGGRVIVRHGPIQRVTLVRGSLDKTSIAVDDGSDQRRGNSTFRNAPDRLVISARPGNHRDYDLLVEIVTPDIDAVAIEGGGTIAAEGDFPDRPAFAAAITGGGRIDIRAIDANSVSAAIRGGGEISTRPETALSAAIMGGGIIRYWGEPQKSIAVQGGGSVVRGGQ